MPRDERTAEDVPRTMMTSARKALQSAAGDRHVRSAAAPDPAWAHYPNTVLELRAGAELLVVDLRRSLGAWRATLAKLGPSHAFGIVTAFNPRGRILGRQRNARNQRRLAEHLVKCRAPHLPADGISPDRRHREAGFAIWISRARVREIAVSFEQSAFFWFDGREFWVVGALVTAPPQRLPSRRTSAHRLS